MASESQLSINGDQPTELEGGIVRVDPNARIWRHWYTTLEQMILDMGGLDAPSDIRIGRLPGGFSIAGEWYLAVPEHSASHDVGLEIIKLMINGVADRGGPYARGVGLPTSLSGHASTIDKDIPLAEFDESFFAGFDPFQRSRFACYAQFAETLAQHLTWIIELHADVAKITTPELEQSATDILRRLHDRFGLIRGNKACRCHPK